MQVDSTGTRLAPRQFSSAAEVIERAALTIAFRASFRPKPLPPAPKILPPAFVAAVIVQPEWPHIQFKGQCLNDYGNRAGDYQNPKRGKIGPSVDSIQRAISQHFLISKKDLISARRDKCVCVPRQIAMWICRKCTSQTYPAIGRCFGGRDHTTAINAFDKIERLRAEGDPIVLAALHAIGERLCLFIPA